MEPTQEQLDAKFREEVLRARRMTPEERVMEGFRLFERERQIMKEGIRAEFPDAGETRVNEILRERLEAKWRLEDVGYIQVLPQSP